MSAAVAAKLREARALIKRGWTQGDYVALGCFCASGAISKVTVGRYDEGDGEVTEQSPEFRRVISALGKAVNCNLSYEIARWNDAPERTKAQVIDAFDKAIELASGTEAGTGETEGLDPKGDGPTGEAGDAQ